MEEQETTETINSNSVEQDEEIIYPNPADQFFYVEQNFNNEKLNDDCTIFMIDLFGRTVLIQPTQIENGILKTIVDLPDSISAGIYLVEVRTASTHSVQRIIISK
ncbi:hypothetical protein LBMAG27_15580 [Bacteroidota bacterium]|nr:hypothetical protein LBMAG27_15580 [Bacteroidota bacterium]